MDRICNFVEYNKIFLKNSDQILCIKKLHIFKFEHQTLTTYLTHHVDLRVSYDELFWDK